MTESLLFWGFGLLAIAVLLQIVEIFVPSLGVLTITALVVAIAGVVCLWSYSTAFGLIGVGLVLVGGPTIFFVGLHLMPHTPFGRMLVLGADDPSQDPQRPAASPLDQLVGSEAIVATDLRPVGTVRIGNEKFDAFAESDMLRAGTKVKVVSVVDGTALRVRAIS